MRKILLNSVFLISIISMLYSCQPVVKAVYGIKEPKITNTTETQKFLSKKKIVGKDIYFKSATDMSRVTKEGGGFSLPDAIFYNKNGQQVNFRTKASDCANDITLFIKNISQIDSLPVKEGIELNRLLQHLSDSKGNSIQPSKNVDAVVFLNWSTYMGNLNKTVFEWTEILQKTSERNDIKVEYYLLSFDYMDSWKDKDLIK